MADNPPAVDDRKPTERAFVRREFIALAGIGGLAIAGAVRSRSWSQPATATSLPAARWSDPATWGGRVPSRGDVVWIGKPVLLDVNAEVAGVRIGPRGSLVFDPARSRRLASRGNIVVKGRLETRPAGPHIVHRIVFVDVNEARFRGGHVRAPLPSDVGLWIVGAGMLDSHGTPKTPWTNLARAAQGGDRAITVVDATGWRVGDEIVITPTQRPTVRDHWAHHDRRRITSISGRTIRLDRALTHRHPAVRVRPGVIRRAEVLNLTRNVVISGTPRGPGARDHADDDRGRSGSPTSGCDTWAPAMASTRCSAVTRSTSTSTATAHAARWSTASSCPTRPVTPSPPTSRTG